MLIEGFTNGFPLHFQGQERSEEYPNHASFRNNPIEARGKIMREIQKGRVEGPFTTPPFANFRVSPLGLVPKKELGEFRVIHDLSFPKGDSINSGIPDELCMVK